jgi:hypothetical protein
MALNDSLKMASYITAETHSCALCINYIGCAGTVVTATNKAHTFVVKLMVNKNNIADTSTEW